MSQVNLVSIDLAQPTENKVGNSNSSSSTTGESNENGTFGQLVDSHIDKNGKDRGHSENSGNNSTHKGQDNAKRTEKSIDKNNEESTKATKESSEEQKLDTEQSKQVSSEEQTDKKSHAETTVQVVENSTDKDSKQKSGESTPKQLIDLLAKSEQMLAENKSGSEDKAAESEQKSSSNHNELITDKTKAGDKSDSQKSTDKHLASKGAVDDSQVLATAKENQSQDEQTLAVENDKSSSEDSVKKAGNLSPKSDTSNANKQQYANDLSKAFSAVESKTADSAAKIPFNENNDYQVDQALAEQAKSQLKQAPEDELRGELPVEPKIPVKNTGEGKQAQQAEQNKDQQLVNASQQANRDNGQAVNGAAKEDTQAQAQIANSANSEKSAKTSNQAGLNNASSAASNQTQMQSSNSQSANQQASNQDANGQSASANNAQNELNEDETQQSDGKQQSQFSVVNAENKQNTQQVTAHATTFGIAKSSSENQQEISEQQQLQQQLDSIANKVVAENVEVKKAQQIQQEVISVYRKDFANALKDKVMLMINQKLQQVDIQLDPPELGNVHVRVNLQNEAAAVSFTVQSQQAKEALEQHMAKLKDMLGQSGVDVGDANVAQQGQQANKEGQQAFSGSNDNEHFEQNFDESSMASINMAKASATGIDFYA